MLEKITEGKNKIIYWYSNILIGSSTAYNSLSSIRVKIGLSVVAAVFKCSPQFLYSYLVSSNLHHEISL